MGEIVRTVTLSANGLLHGLSFQMAINKDMTEDMLINNFLYLAVAQLRLLGMNEAVNAIVDYNIHYHGKSIWETEPNDIIYLCCNCNQ